MSRDVPGALDPAWPFQDANKPRVRNRRSKVHLRVGDPPLAGPAFGNDLQAASRGVTSTTTLTDDPDLVTCAVCRRSYAFQVRAGK